MPLFRKVHHIKLTGLKQLAAFDGNHVDRGFARVLRLAPDCLTCLTLDSKGECPGITLHSCRPPFRLPNLQIFDSPGISDMDYMDQYCYEDIHYPDDHLKAPIRDLILKDAKITIGGFELVLRSIRPWDIGLPALPSSGLQLLGYGVGRSTPAAS